ncbi:MAG: YbaK/EbsC family protein [Chloroflexota bacterium]
MKTEQENLLNRIQEWARSRCNQHDLAHDSLHLERVHSIAFDLLGSEEFDADARPDPFVTLAACWLHDVVQIPKGSGEPGQAARESAEVSRTFLLDLGVDRATTDSICAAVEAHSFSGGARPPSVEAAIVQDADRIDALGAIGIARFLTVAAGGDGNLYDPQDPLARKRALDDRRYALDHVLTKLVKLPSMMTTVAGAELAQQRAAFLIDYVVQLAAEIGVPSPAGYRIRAMIESRALLAKLLYPGEHTPSVPDAARALGVGADRILKSLLFTNGRRHVLAIASGEGRVNIKRLENATEQYGLKLAKPHVVLQLTGFEVGAMPPVGHRRRFQVIMDDAVARLDLAYGGGGSVDSLLQITPDEIVRQECARIAPVAD